MAPGDDAAIMRTVEALQARNIHVIVTDTREEANNALIQLLPEGAEIGSVQAIAETGEIFVASATGSQLAPYVYAAKRVILVVGVQKIVPTFDAAMQRVRGHTLARHDQWLAEMGRASTPIGKLGIIEHESQAGRITVILVKERLGW